MPTYDKTGSGNQPPAVGVNSVYAMKQRIDLKVAGAGNAAAVVASDVVKVFDLPNGCVILAFGLKVVVPAAGTTQTVTFGSANGGNISGTAAMVAGSTPQASGVIDLATLTDPTIPSKVTLPSKGFEWLETEIATSSQPYLSLTMTTMTAITDPGVVDVFAVIADLTGVVPRDPNSARPLTNLGEIAGYPVV